MCRSPPHYGKQMHTPIRAAQLGVSVTKTMQHITEPNIQLK